MVGLLSLLSMELSMASWLGRKLFMVWLIALKDGRVVDLCVLFTLLAIALLGPLLQNPKGEATCWSHSCGMSRRSPSRVCESRGGSCPNRYLRSRHSWYRASAFPPTFDAPLGRWVR